MEKKTPYLNTGFDGNGSDLLDDFRGRVQIDQTLVDSHFELVKGLRTVTARRLAGGDAKDLGGQADGTLDLELLVLGTLDQISADYRHQTGYVRDTLYKQNQVIFCITYPSPSS